MAIVLNNVTSGYNVSTINSNFQKIEDYVNDKLLARAATGVAGEAMMARDLDMNGHSILNAVTGSSSGSLVTKGYVDAADAALQAQVERTLRFPSNMPQSVLGPSSYQNALQGYNNLNQPVPIFSYTATADLALKLAASNGASLVGGLGIITPEMKGAVGDGVAYDDAALASAISTPYSTVLLTKTYRYTSILSPAEGVTIIGGGKLVNETTGSFTWSTSNRASNYPAIMVNQKNITISGITIVAKYEAIQAASGGDSLRIFNVKGGGTSTTRSSSSAFVFFNVSNVHVDNCECAYTGAVATWNGSDIQNGGCDGIDFGAIQGIRITNTYCHDVGRNGINWFGASNVIIANCRQSMCGQNGIQPGPHPSYSGIVITGNTAEYCCADAIDCRYTGSPAVDVNMVVSNCRSNWIGMLYGDTNYISNDGTGCVTLALVKKFTVTGCQSNNASGVVMWFEGCEDGIVSDIMGTSAYTKYGIGFFTSCTRIALSNINVSVKGSALWFGGNSAFTDVTVGGNSHFESSDSYALLMPNNTLTRFKIANSTFTGYNVANVIFPTVNCEFRLLSTTTSGFFNGASNLKHTNLTVTGATSGVLVDLGTATGVVLQTPHLVNSGSGATFRTVAANGLMVNNGLIWNTGTGAGNAIAVTGGQNGSVISNCDIFSNSGYWILSTAASHTKFVTDQNRENGSLGASWTSITNVFNVSTVQRT